MLFLGHLGLGYQLARPWWSRLKVVVFFLGTLLPDLIDKPLYYVPALLTGRKGLELGLICGTRTFGHTLLFLGLCALIVAFRRRDWVLSLALGMGTHLALDLGGDLIEWDGRMGTLQAALFPLRGAYFLVLDQPSLFTHFFAKLTPYNLAGEILGAATLWWLWKRRRRQMLT